MENLAAAGVHVDAKNANGNTALMLAAQEGRLQAVRVLLGARADPVIRNKKREQAHTIAAAANHPEVTALLQEHKSIKKSQHGLF